MQAGIVESLDWSAEATALTLPEFVAWVVHWAVVFNSQVAAANR